MNKNIDKLINAIKQNDLAKFVLHLNTIDECCEKDMQILVLEYIKDDKFTIALLRKFDISLYIFERKYGASCLMTKDQSINKFIIFKYHEILNNKMNKMIDTFRLDNEIGAALMKKAISRRFH